MSDTSNHRPRAGAMIGATTAIGAGAGGAMFAATGSPAWIAVGAGAGAALGAVLGLRSR